MQTKTRISDGQNWNFTWDYRNRLTQLVVKNASGTILSQQNNTYDVFDRRIGVYTNVGGVTSQMWTVYDGVNTYADFDGSGNLTNRYLYGLAVDQLFGKMDASGNSRWYLTDLVGSVRLLTNPSGGVLDTVSYDSFGNILSESSPANGDRFKFTGRELDSVSGQYNYRARELDPLAGRFTSEDRLGFEGEDANLYRYVGNSSVAYVDPTGFFRFSADDKRRFFNSPEEAAADWGNRYNGLSIIEGQEYGSTIYRTKDGKYAYTEPATGGNAAVNPSKPSADEGKAVADIHSHGKYERGYNNDNFSRADKADNRAQHIPGYLTTPNGTLQKYDQNTDRVTIILRPGTLAADPNDPTTPKPPRRSGLQWRGKLDSSQDQEL
jgi:RHS repeat-associated protein